MKSRRLMWGCFLGWFLVCVGSVGTALGQQPWGTMGPNFATPAAYTYGGGDYAYTEQAPTPTPAPGSAGAVTPAPAGEDSCGLMCLPRYCSRLSRRCCNGCLPDPWTLFPEYESGLRMGGWFSAGVYANARGADWNGPIGYREEGDAFTSDQNWFFAEKIADTSRRPIDWGFRFDILFGADAPNTRAFHNSENAWDNAWISSDDGVYGSAIPQLYGEIAWNKLSVKLGHFFSPLGYERVPVIENFFYSHSYCQAFGEPQTMTGVLASYAVTDALKVHGGWTTDWNTAFDNPWDAQLFLGGIDLLIGERITFSWMVSAGDWGQRWDLDFGDLYMNTFVVKFQLNQRWTYVFQHDMGLISNAGEQSPNGQWYGINQYLLFKINECWSLGGRFEWFRDDDALVVPSQLGLGNRADYYALTLGLNWKPHANITIRPELRYDWATGQLPVGNRPFNDGDNREQFSGGVDFIITY